MPRQVPLNLTRNIGIMMESDKKTYRRKKYGVEKTSGV